MISNHSCARCRSLISSSRTRCEQSSLDEKGRLGLCFHFKVLQRGVCLCVDDQSLVKQVSVLKTDDFTNLHFLGLLLVKGTLALVSVDVN